MSHDKSRMHGFESRDLRMSHPRYHHRGRHNYRCADIVAGRDINTDPVIVAQLQTQPGLVSRSPTYPGSKSSPFLTSHPSRVYVSPPWRRSTTVGGPSSLPPCLAALWMRWWRGRASSSQTGSCPGCRFSFPSMFWLWAGLRQRASSGEINLTQPFTCLDLSSVRDGGV